MQQRLLTRWLPLSLLLVGAVSILIACGGGGNDDTSDPVLETERSQALGLFDKLPVSWTPTKLVFNLNPGSRQSIPVTLTTTKALTNARVVFVPDLRNAVTVSPSTIPTLAAGQSATVTLTFAPSATDTRKVIAGVVLLYDRNATVSRPLPVKVSLVAQETINGVAVPPEPPPELNNATLAGFDVNVNGVRDDVDRYIATEYPTSARARSSLTQRAAALQQVLISPDYALSKRLLDAARDCMMATFSASPSDADGARKSLGVGRALTERMVNTPARLTAYAAYNQTRSGTVTTLTAVEEVSSRCLVNPSSLTN
jgi:hypothetical protein